MVLGWTHRRGARHLVLVHPDGTRSLIPASWTDLVPDEAAARGAHEGEATLASVAQLLRMRVVIDALLRRLPAVPSDRSQPEVSPRARANSDELPRNEADRARRARRARVVHARSDKQERDRGDTRSADRKVAARSEVGVDQEVRDE